MTMPELKNNLNYVFVYGTLKRGYGNNVLLREENFITTGATVPHYYMFGGGFPYAVPERFVRTNLPTLPIIGEVWSINQPGTLERLDSLEGYSPDHPHNHYERTPIVVDGDDGNEYYCFIYEYHRVIEHERQSHCLNDGYYEWGNRFLDVA